MDSTAGVKVFVALFGGTDIELCISSSEANGLDLPWTVALPRTRVKYRKLLRPKYERKHGWNIQATLRLQFP